MEPVALLALLAGVVGIALIVIAFQMNNRRTMLRIHLASCLVWSMHYVLIGASTGASMTFFAAARCYVFDRYRAKTWALPAFILGFIVAALATWKGWTSILPLIGMCLATLAMWQKNPRNIRLISLTVTPFWLSYNFFHGSYVGMAADIITFSSVLIAVCRFDLLPVWSDRFRKPRPMETIEGDSVILTT